MSTSRKVVLLKLCDRASDDGGNCYPSIKTVALAASMSPRQTKRVIHWLIDNGYVGVVGNQYGGAPGNSRRYQINVSALTTGVTGVTGDNLSRVTVETGTGDMGGTRRVTSATETGDMGDTQYTINTSTDFKSIRQGAKPKRSPRNDVSGKRLPDDWQPEARLLDEMKIECPTVDLKKATVEFHDYWRGVPGQKGCKADWPATWRNSVRRISDFHARGQSNRNPAKPSIAENFAGKTYTGTPEHELPSFLQTNAA